MRALLSIAAGVTLAGFVVLAGLLGTPFFGAGAGYWAHVVGALAVALGIGVGLGDRISLLAGNPERAPGRLAVVGGAAVVFAVWGLPRVARALLDRDPDSPWAAALFALIDVALPLVIVASILGASARLPSTFAEDDDGKKRTPEDAARALLRRFALAMLGGVAGVAIALVAFRDGAAGPRIYLVAYALGVGLLVIGAIACGGPGRVLGVGLSSALAGVVFGAPSEIQSSEFLNALGDAASPPGAGVYYATSPLTPAHRLTGTNIQKKVEEARKRLRGNDGNVAVLLMIETLRRLGAANISGEGLRQTLDLYLGDASKPLVMPFLEKIASVKSDGSGTFAFKIKDDVMGTQGMRIAIPSAKGEPQRFLFKSDFTLTLIEDKRSTETITRIEIGPRTVEPGIVNDTNMSPVVCENVALWLDAWLLGVIVENKTDQVIVRAVAQAKIGGIQTAVLQVVDKLELKREQDAVDKR